MKKMYPAKGMHAHVLYFSAAMLQHKKISLALLLLAGLFCSLRSQAQLQWFVMGNEQQVGTATSAYTSIATTVEGNTSVPYVVFTEANIAKVKKFIAGAWEQVGGNVSAGNATYTRIYADRNNKLYVTYVDAANSNRLAVKTYNTASLAWEPLGNDANNLYVSAGTVTNTISQYSSTARSSFAFDTAAKPYVFFGEGSTLLPTVKRFNGTAWENVGGTSVSADRAVGVGIAIDSTNNNPTVAYLALASATSTTGTITVYNFNGTAWSNLPVPNPVLPGSSSTGSSNAARHTALTFNSLWHPVVAYFNASNSNRSTIITYNKDSARWIYYGTVSTRDASNINLYRDKAGNIYNSFTDVISNGSGRSVARVMKQNAGSTGWTELKHADSTVGMDDYTGNLQIAIGADSLTPYAVYTKANTLSVVTPTVRKFTTVAVAPPPADTVVTTPKQMEFLSRGLVAVRQNANAVYVGWRYFGTDSSSISFNLYRDGVKVNTTPIETTTNFVDNVTTNGTYTLRPIMGGVEQAATPAVPVWTNIYKSIPITEPDSAFTPSGEKYGYTSNDCSVGDLDGDGEYEIIMKWEPTNAKDNSQSGYTGNVFLDALKMDGTRMWRIDLGRNIRAGAHYTQFMVYDLDGDGKAEVACKTADGTVDGTGVTIGNPSADYRNTGGYILDGPEFLTVFNGLTGAAMATKDYVPARGTVSSWGDNYGNRVDRFVNAVAYVDGARPSLIMGRGYYTRLVRAAWDWRNGQLTNRWTFDSNTPGNSAWAGQGNHQLTVGDVDGDGKDEIVNGSSAVNDNGKGLYANGLGHGDAMHMTDLDPERPGQELWQCHEDQGSYGQFGIEFRDGKTGQPLWGRGPNTGVSGDIGRAMAADIDPAYAGYEVWASAGGLYSCKGDSISANKPSYNFGIWWDGDLSRELLDGTKLDKWNPATKSSSRLLTIYNYGGASDNNGTKANPGLTADLLGDWREEMIFPSFDNKNLLIFTTTIPTTYRIYTLMHNPQYRTAVAWQNSAYNQPPYVDYFLGNGMTTPPRPNIFIAAASSLPVRLIAFNAKENKGKVDLSWTTASETNNESFTIERSVDARHFTAIYTTRGQGTSNREHQYFTVDALPFTGANYYRLKQTDSDGKITYSEVRLVNIAGIKGTLQIWPNPVTSSVKLSISSTSGHLNMQVTTADGRTVLQASGSADKLNATLNQQLPALSAGVYNVQVTDGANVFTGRMIKGE